MRKSPSFIRSAHRTNGTHTIMQPRDNEKGGVEEADVPRRGPCSPRGPTGGSALRSLFLCVRGSAATPAALMRRERKSSLRAFRPRAAGAGGRRRGDDTHLLGWKRLAAARRSCRRGAAFRSAGVSTKTDQMYAAPAPCFYFGPRATPTNQISLLDSPTRTHISSISS